MKPGISVLLTKPRDLDYELYIFKKYRGLLKIILDLKEQKTGTLLQDLETLKTNSDLPFTIRMSTVYRSEKKKILSSNIDLCDYVIRTITYLKEQGKRQ